MDEHEIQMKYLNKTPLGSDLKTVLKLHKKELESKDKYWEHYTRHGCQNPDNATVRTEGSIIRGRLGVRLVLEQIFIIYCFDEFDKLEALNIIIEIDGI